MAAVPPAPQPWQCQRSVPRGLSYTLTGGVFPVCGPWSADEAVDAARGAATRSLESHSLTCRPLDVVVDVSAFRPGGWIRVDLACGVNLGRLGSVWTPDGRMLTASATASVETYRGLR